MKKSLLALAVLGAFAGVASAQSSVTLFGTVDMAGRYTKADGQDRRLTLATNGINSSQLGFRGIEDLGGGLKAGFYLLADLAPIDTGNAASKFFGRRATVSLYSNMGELRLGRDYTPTFWNQTIFDAFGTNGLGSSLNVRQGYGGTRQDNSVGYFLPSNLGGFYGQAMASAAEGGTTLDRPARYLGGRIGFAAGPFDIAAAYSDEKMRANATIASAAAGQFPIVVAAGDSQKTWNVGGSWDFGFAKLLGYYDHEKIPNAKEDVYSISGVIPFGQAEVHVGYDRSKGHVDNLGSATVEQFKVTLQYNVSKRTALYTTGSLLKNKDDTRLTLPGAAGLTTLGDDSKGFEIGVRHFF